MTYLQKGLSMSARKKSYNFRLLIEEYTEKEKISDLFKESNKGKLKQSGVKQLVHQIESNKLSYCGFPEWVLKSWLDPSKSGALPLKDNRWLDTQSVVNGSTEIDPDDVIYSGFVVDADRKTETGVKSVSLNKSDELDISKYRKLLTFKLAGNEAKRVIAKKKHSHENEEQDSTTKEEMNIVPQEPQQDQFASL